MTYEEYKNNKSNKNNLFKNLLNKLFTIIIFSMIIIIISNHSPKFKSFIIDKVLNSTMDFSVFNKLLNKTTNVFKNEEETKPVLKEINESIKYKDGVKYLIGENEKVLLKDSGIVTFIGKKDGYNNTIIIQQSNGYYAWYGNVKESIKLYDYVESGTVIGTAEKEYYYVLLKDDKPVESSNS
jgi:hypothetical protein